MASRVVIRGRTAWASKDYPRSQVDRLPRHKDGSVIVDERVSPFSPDSPYRAGSPYYDTDDQLEYRSVSPQALDPVQGWRTAEFWLDRWRVSWSEIRTLVEMGWLDAAIEHGGATKRFRCRDEVRVLAWVKSQKVQVLAKKKHPRSKS